MSYRNKSFIITILLILIIQILLYANNRQKSSFRYFIWNIQEISIGKLLSISFASGFLVTTILNKNINISLKSDYLKDEVGKGIDYEDQSNGEYLKKEIDIPPQRDVRDTQPTISVNYRVIKNNNANDLNIDKNSTDNFKYEDDWNDREIEW